MQCISCIITDWPWEIWLQKEGIGKEKSRICVTDKFFEHFGIMANDKP